jgi:hypothetical protein
MNKLIELGFEDAASVDFRNPAPNNGIAIDIAKYESATNILYAVIFHSAEKEDDIPVTSEVVYIGHTRRTFRNRMNGYQSGCGTAVNNRIHEAMKAHLSNGGSVTVMVLPDKHGLYMQDIHLDVAAGLEYSLIDYYCRFNRDHGHRPLFNIAGNNCLKKAGQQPMEVDIEDAQQAMLEEDLVYPDLHLQDAEKAPTDNPNDECSSLPCSFTFELTAKIYWPKPVFNVPVHYQRHFGPHGDVLQVQLTGQQPATLQLTVDRNANQGTHAPRIYFGGKSAQAYKTWKQANSAEGDRVTVTVVARNSIALA